MATFGDAIVDGIRTAWCAYFRTVEGAEDWFARVSPLPVPDPFGDFSDSLYRWTCGTNETPPQLPEPPFAGGQCPVAYSVTVRYADEFQQTPGGWVNREFFAVRECVGPIFGLEGDPGGPPPAGELSIVHGSPKRWTRTGLITVPFPCSTNSEFFRNCNAEILSAVRVDGLPDECGNLPPVFPPVTPVTIDVDINDNDTIINAPVTIGPFFVTAVGGIYAPVTIDLPDVNLNGTLEITPEFTFFPDFDLNIGTPPEGPETEPPPDSPTGPGESEPEDEPEPPSRDRRIIAVLVNGRIESDARPSGIYQEVGPNIYAPRLASVRFGTQISGTIFWANDIPVKTLRGVIECPIPWGASHVVLNAEPGVAMSYSTVSSEPMEYPPFLELGPNELSDNR